MQSSRIQEDSIVIHNVDKNVGGELMTALEAPWCAHGDARRLLWRVLLPRSLRTVRRNAGHTFVADDVRMRVKIEVSGVRAEQEAPMRRKDVHR